MDDDGRLIIESLKESHAGEYTCVAENIAGKSEKSVKVIVTCKLFLLYFLLCAVRLFLATPVITSNPESITVDENERAVLMCNHEIKKESEPYTTIRWRKDGKLIKHDYEDLGMNHQRIRIYKHNGTLLIHSTKAQDRGEYVCEITTAGFEPVISKAATISVIGAYLIQVKD